MATSPINVDNGAEDFLLQQNKMLPGINFFVLKYRAGFVFLSFFGVRIPLTTIEQDEKQPTFEELQCASRFPSAIEFSTPINHTHRNFRHHINKFVKTLVPNILTSDTYTLYQNTRQTVTLSTALSNMHEVFTDWEPSDTHEFLQLFLDTGKHLYTRRGMGTWYSWIHYSGTFGSSIRSY